MRQQLRVVQVSFSWSGFFAAILQYLVQILLLNMQSLGLFSHSFASLNSSCHFASKHVLELKTLRCEVDPKNAGSYCFAFLWVAALSVLKLR